MVNPRSALLWKILLPWAGFMGMVGLFVSRSFGAEGLDESAFLRKVGSALASPFVLGLVLPLLTFQKSIFKKWREALAVGVALAGLLGGPVVGVLVLGKLLSLVIPGEKGWATGGVVGGVGGGLLGAWSAFKLMIWLTARGLIRFEVDLPSPPPPHMKTVLFKRPLSVKDGGNSLIFLSLIALFVSLVSASTQPNLFFGPSSLLFLGLLITGLMLAFGRRCVLVDGTTRTVTSWLSVWFPPLRRITQGRDEFVGVKILRTRPNRVVVHRVLLQGRNRDLILSEYGDYATARQKGEQVATLLGLSLWDEGSDIPVVSPAGDAMRARQAGGMLQFPDVFLDGESRTVRAGGNDYPFDHFAAVSIIFKKRWLNMARNEQDGWGTSTYTPTKPSYTLFLISRNGEAIVATQCPNYLMARAQARALAIFLGLSVRDQTVVPPLELAAGTFEQSLAERAHRDGVVYSRPPRPAEGKITCQCEREGAFFELPVPWPGWMFFLISGIMFGLLTSWGALLVGGTLLSILNISLDRSLGWLLVTGLGVVGWAAAVPLQRRAALLRRERVVVSPKGLRLERGNRNKPRCLELPASAIEQVEIQSPRLSKPWWSSPTRQDVIGICSSSKMLEFGYDLSPEELLWLRDMLRHLLTSAAASSD
jgi:hypothetical protein